MRGRQVFFETLLAHGVDRIFGNPGTTESPLLDSLLDYPQLQYIVHLHEGVAVGAANFYAQASGKTAFVNLHVAPGLGNGIGMIYSALKNNSPMVVTAGQQDTRIRLRDPVLGHDLAAMAAPVTKWSVQVESADELGPILQRAFKIANDAPAGPVFVALPINVMEQETKVPAGKPAQVFTASRPDPAGIEAMSRLIIAAKNPAIVAGDDVARAGAGKTLEKLVERIGASVWFEGLRGRNSFPTDHPAYRGTLAFDAPGIAKQFAENDLVLLVGGPFFEEVWYGPGSPFPAGCKVLQIEAAPPRMAYNFAVDAGVIADVDASLEALWQTTTGINGAAARARQDAFRAQKQADDAAQKARVEKAWSRTPTSMARVMAELKAASPTDVVVVDETITANLDLFKTFTFSGCGRLLQRPRRRHRPGRGGCARRRGGRARPADPLPLGRRLVDVLHPGAVDGGAPRPADRVRDPGQPRIPRAEAQHRRLPRALRREVEQALHAHGPERPRAGLRRPRQGHGRGRHARHQGRGHPEGGGGCLQVRQAAPDRDRDRREAVVCFQSLPSCRFLTAHSIES